MRLIEWSEEDFGLNNAEMDATHKEFIDLVNRLEEADSTEFQALFAELVEHTRQHFARENDLMEASHFPAIREHRSEHDRVLGEMTQFGQRVARGLVPLGRAYLRQALPDWFRFHASTMDSALAAHLAMKAA